MRFRYGTILLFSLSLSTVAQAQTTRERLSSAQSFAFALGVDVEETEIVTKLSSYDLIVLDGEETPARVVAALRANGAIVLGYLSVGTIERYRSWYRDVRRYRLERWDDWGEWYADTSKRRYRDLITRRVAPRILRKGFDGLFLDNFDMILTHRRQAPGMRSLIRSLASLVHARGKLLFLQNGEEALAPLLGVIDGWNREDVTFTYDFDSSIYQRVSTADHEAALEALRMVSAQGVFTTAADYIAAEDAAAQQEAAAAACSVGALPFVGDIDLSRLPMTPLTCE